MAKHISRKDLAMGKRFANICENLFPGKSRQYIADSLGVVHESRIRLFEGGSIPETAVLKILDDYGYSIEWLLLNRGEMKKSGDHPAVPMIADSEIKAATGAFPKPNAIAQRGSLDLTRKPQAFHVVGQAAADESHGNKAGIFPQDAGQIWDDVEIPATTHFVKILGDSMAPVLLDGQYAMVGPEYIPHYSQPAEREIVVAEVTVKDQDQASADGHFEGVYCKRVRDLDTAWLFESINYTGAPFSIAKTNCRLWPVVGVYFAGKGKPPKED